MTKINKEIQVLSEEEHILLRPTMWVGSIDATEEKIPIIDNFHIIEKIKKISIGMMKCFDEIFDNALDEMKRCYVDGKHKGFIIVKLNTKENSIEICDNGNGFKNAEKIHNKTNLSNVATALSQLRSGSNFENEKINENIIGTNGVGAAIVNVLSEYFSVTTINQDIYYNQVWENFQSIAIEHYPKRRNQVSGTVIKFIPRKTIFKRQKWDVEFLITKLIFKNFLIKHGSFKNLDLKFYVDEKEMDLNIDFIPQTHLIFEQILPTMNYKIYFWEKYENSCSVSFVNDAICQGIHQKIIHDELNIKLFDNEKAHNYYESFVILNLPPKYVKFGDQNKTKFVSTRFEINNILNFNLSTRQIKNLINTDFYKNINNAIIEFSQRGELKKLKKAKKQNKIKISEKYFPSELKDTLFITEGNSAKDSLLQERDTKLHAVYALRGKIKNTRDVKDLSENNVILDLMNILDLDLEQKTAKCKFKKIVIATDADCDGAHISSLIINFFNKWFPDIIKSGRLFMLKTPLISIENNKKREYFYDLTTFEKSFSKKNNVRYLKGLGSLDIQDWRMIFNNMHLYKLYIDKYTAKILDIAFSESSLKRKIWLEK